MECRDLWGRGHKVVFVGARGMPENETTREIPTYRYRSIPLPKSDGWRLALPTPRELTEVFAKEDIDVVHITIPTPCAIAAANDRIEPRGPIIRRRFPSSIRGHERQGPGGGLRHERRGFGRRP